MSFGLGSDQEQLGSGNSGGVSIGKSGGKASFYGAVPVVQRPYSSAVHATSAASVSSSFGATQLAILQEIQNTLIGLNIWATA